MNRIEKNKLLQIEQVDKRIYQPYRVISANLTIQCAEESLMTIGASDKLHRVIYKMFPGVLRVVHTCVYLDEQRWFFHRLTLVAIMKPFLLFLILIKSSILPGQPSNLVTNATKRDSVNTPLLQNFIGNYDFILGFTKESYWWKGKQVYEVLVRENDKWQAFQILSKKNKNGKIKRETTRYDFNPDSANQLMENLTQLGFWTFDRDSLNVRHIAINDSTNRYHQIDDGVNYKFEVLTNSSHRIIESYAPDNYYEQFPQLTIRKAFIDCRQLFVSAFRKNRSN